MAEDKNNEEDPNERKNEYFDDDEDFGLPDLEYDELDDFADDDDLDEPLEEEIAGPEEEVVSESESIEEKEEVEQEEQEESVFEADEEEDEDLPEIEEVVDETEEEDESESEETEKTLLV